MPCVNPNWLRVLLVVLVGMWAGFVDAATYYVATTGSDGGTGSDNSPWATIGYGTSHMSSGDTLVVKAGTYQDLPNFINSRAHSIPSGTALQYTTIRAENPFSVRIKNTGPLNYWDNMVLLSGDYIQVDGFIFDMTNSADPEYNATVDGNYNKITRSIFRRTGKTSEYGGWVYVGGSYNLIEDCAGVGSARYGFSTGGPTATSAYNIFRRCVGRIDYTDSNQPKATFNAYGNNSGNQVHDILFQNCIAIDGKRGPSTNEDTYGGFYFPKNATNIFVRGSIALNVEAGHAGYFVKELQGQNIVVDNSIAWGGYGGSWIAGLRANGSTPGPLTFNHMTVGGYPTAYYNYDSASTRTLTNSLFYANATLTSADYGWTTVTNNAFSPASQKIGSNAVTNNVALLYLVRAEPATGLASAATDGADIGANITKRHGQSGTLWGQTGYDQPTQMALWPWPRESQIKAVFSETNNPPSGMTPSTNNTRRGFCADTDQFGKAMTLTRYIWQYLGNQIPSDIYSSSVAPPGTLTGTLIK